MNRILLDRIVDAVLYEGYILYPYRSSSKKNQQRFTFGRVYPLYYHKAQDGAEPWTMQTECLLKKNPGDEPNVSVTIRFLQPSWRRVGKLTSSSGTDISFVPQLEIAGKVYQSWQEAIERSFQLPAVRISNSLTLATPFSFDSSRSVEPIIDEFNSTAGFLVRSNERIKGQVVVEVASHGKDAYKIRVQIQNTTPQSLTEDPLMHTFASTHTILKVDGGEFISSFDPPEEWKAATAECKNIGTWPVFVGDEEKGERDTLLSSPIILYDFPKIAPESAGNLFDSTEIDEILTLRILTMTDEEKKEIRGIDQYARSILERTENLEHDALLRMHGAKRDESMDDLIFGANKKNVEGVHIGNSYLRKGDRVRICPRVQADIMDIVLKGKIAIIEAVEEDAEGKIHLPLVLEDDPGKDLGFMRQIGHRFFYSPDDVEPA